MALPPVVWSALGAMWRRRLERCARDDVSAGVTAETGPNPDAGRDHEVSGMAETRLTTWALQRKKEQGERLVMVTAYDATFARLADRAQVDMILVGDSLGNVVQGHETTLPVTLDEMIYHCRCVARGAARAFLVGDLPFGAYQVSLEQGMASGLRLMKEGAVQAVKLEGGAVQAPLVARLTACGVPVMGHLGLTPQSVHQLGGYRVQGRNAADEQRIFDDALALEAAGAFALVLECVPAQLAQRVQGALRIPVIGIGAGSACDGQVLVIYDLLGLYEGSPPKFVKNFATLTQVVGDALRAYGEEVRSGAFPASAHSFE